ncbi:hypothetical protein EAH79_14495 [Sphingomonas koreensis]|nr:hypothetical protein EAH79_14495 [Sphingomonas koreensis]
MGTPVEMDIPHQLGKAGVRARLDGGIGKISTMIPGGAVVDHRWEGDTMFFTVKAMGQTIGSKLETFEDKVHAIIDLPPMMALFANQIKAALQQEGQKLLK